VERSATSSERGKSRSGSLFHLEVRWGRSATWVGPAWAVLCGSLASGRSELSLEGVILFLLAVFLADVLLGTIWAQAMDLASANPASGEGMASKTSSKRRPVRLPSLPYSLPGSLGQRFLDWMANRTVWWRDSVWPRHHVALAGLSLAVPLSIALAVFFGRGTMLLLLVAWALVTLGSLGMARRSPRLKGRALSLGLLALYSGGMAWLMGYEAFRGFAQFRGAPVSGLKYEAILWALIYAAVFYAYRIIEAGALRRGARILFLSQIVGVALLIVLKEPIVAGAVALLLLPQMLLETATEGRGSLWYLRHVQLFTMAAVLLGALAVPS
jgi:hypothetical protein